MPKIKRNLDTQESRDFWAHVDKCAAEVATWPEWKRVGISEPPQMRSTPREPVEANAPEPKAKHRAKRKVKSETESKPEPLTIFERLLKE